MTLTEKLKHKYALSDTGAKAMLRAFAAVTVANLVLMLPIGLLYTLSSHLLEGELPQEKFGTFIIAIIFVLALIAVTAVFQYRATFLSTYIESGVRRRTLADLQRLRRAEVHRRQDDSRRQQPHAGRIRR